MSTPGQNADVYKALKHAWTESRRLPARGLLRTRPGPLVGEGVIHAATADSDLTLCGAQVAVHGQATFTPARDLRTCRACSDAVTGS